MPRGKEFEGELKPLPSNLRYEFLGSNSTHPVIVGATLNENETSKLLHVLKNNRKALGYSIDDLKGISPSLCMHRINVDENAKPSREFLRRLNPNLSEVVFKEITKLRDAGFHQIPILPNDQGKTTFICPYGTFAFGRMPFGLCNAPGTFQRCMMSIFSDYIEKCMEVFMDDFSIHGTSFDDCLTNLSHVLASRGVEVDKAKVQVIEQLPPPKDQKGVRSFLGHAGFYQRFIKDFSKIAKPLTHLLCNDVQFNFDEDFLEAFEKLKRALVSAPIVRPPNWDLPFELMCDASDYAIGAVLGQ
ncbi:unnamed protein product [Rhodiola kirilowii]